MQNMQEYKCPCCGGAIAFDSTIQKMKCPYCDSEFEMETLQAMDEQLKEGKSDSMEWETKAGGEWQEGETDGLSTYVCQSCGGEIVGDATMAEPSVRFVTIRLFSRENSQVHSGRIWLSHLSWTRKQPKKD